MWLTYDLLPISVILSWISTKFKLDGIRSRFEIFETFLTIALFNIKSLVPLSLSLNKWNSVCLPISLIVCHWVCEMSETVALVWGSRSITKTFFMYFC